MQDSALHSQALQSYVLLLLPMVVGRTVLRPRRARALPLWTHGDTQLRLAPTVGLNFTWLTATAVNIGTPVSNSTTQFALHVQLPIVLELKEWIVGFGATLQYPSPGETLFWTIGP